MEETKQFILFNRIMAIDIDYGPKRKYYGTPVEVRTTPKVGRNQICPCGSGLKHKKCCAKKKP